MCGVAKLWHWQGIYNLHHKQTPHTLDIARLFKSFDFLPFKYFKAIWSINRLTLSVPKKRVILETCQFTEHLTSTYYSQVTRVRFFKDLIVKNTIRPCYIPFDSSKYVLSEYGCRQNQMW
jgi:6-pyruvoyl-tetrahydropterin synthase